MPSRARLVSWLLVLAASCPGASAVDFTKDIRPIFEAHCLKCHGPEKQKGGYRLDRKEIALHGGDNYAPNILPGKSGESPLVQFVSGHDAEMIMPPKGERLTSAQTDLLRAWIDQGATWPDEDGADADRPLAWWSLAPLTRLALPVSSAFSRNPIDAFILAKLAEKGLTPSPEADRRTLIRRLFFNLIGLPPKPQEINAFLADKEPGAYERLVERLLMSPHYGERWARHWLDVARYGDTHGYDKDQPRHHAWPYRDYVIRALNEDKPYARFVQEQIAGDVLFPGTRDGIEALGFLAAGPWDLIGHMEVAESKIDGKIARMLDRDDMVSNALNTFTSLTVQCARCHNHKFDRFITQEHYFSLQAVFAALDRADKRYDFDPEIARRRRELETTQKHWAMLRETLRKAAINAAGEPVASLEKQLAALPKPTPNEPGEQAKLTAERERLIAEAMSAEAAQSFAEAGRELAVVEGAIAKLPKPGVVYAGTVHHGTGDFLGTGATGGKPRVIHVLHRGDVQSPRQVVQPGALPIIEGEPWRFALPPEAPESERRAALARWLTDARNPLPWRSMVNRVWQYHFGRGLVETPNDFGRMGQLPTHPELLDWLAAEFRDGGQSLKKLHRWIVTSATYRQSSLETSTDRKLDADNRYLWRMNRRRLEAEAIRDSVLAAAGKLDLQTGGPGFQDFLIDQPEHSPHYEYQRHDAHNVKSHRRAIYRFIVRSQPQPFMSALDCADPSMSVDKRNESQSALQALALMNNSLIVAMAQHFATRLQSEAGDDLNAQIPLAFRLALGREPSAAEQQSLTRHATQHGLSNACRLIFNLNEFVFVD